MLNFPVRPDSFILGFRESSLFFFFFLKRPAPKVRENECGMNCSKQDSISSRRKKKKKKAKQGPGNLPILIPFLCIDSNRPNWAPTVCIDLHWWSCTPQPNSSRFRVLRPPQLATMCVKERSPPTTTSGLVFVSPPENKGWAPWGRWATHSEQVWSQKSAAWTQCGRAGTGVEPGQQGVAFLQLLFCLWALSASAVPHPFYRYQPCGQLSYKESRNKS